MDQTCAAPPASVDYTIIPLAYNFLFPSDNDGPPPGTCDELRNDWFFNSTTNLAKDQIFSLEKRKGGTKLKAKSVWRLIS